MGRVDVGVVLTSTSFDELREGSDLRRANETNETAAGNSTAFSAPLSGVVSLSMVAAGPGTEVPVANLTRPIFFSIPIEVLSIGALKQAHPPINGTNSTVDTDRLAAVCGWWDAEGGGGDGAYSTEGCFTLPNPFPPGGEVSWVPGFRLNSPDYNQTYWHRSWQLDHEIMAGCTTEYDEDEFRMFVDSRAGSHCNISSQANGFECWWDVDAQAFAGPACEYAGSQQWQVDIPRTREYTGISAISSYKMNHPLHSACTHLTDFKVSLSIPKTRITVASAEEMRLRYGCRAGLLT